MNYDASLFDVYYTASGPGAVEQTDSRPLADRERERQIRERMKATGLPESQINQKMGHLAMMGEHPGFYLSTIEDAGDYVVRRKTYSDVPGEVVAVWDQGPGAFEELFTDIGEGIYQTVSAPFQPEFWEDWNWLKWSATVALSAWAGYHVGRWSASMMREGLYNVAGAVVWGGEAGLQGALQIAAAVAAPAAISYGLSYLPGSIGEWAPWTFGLAATVGSYVSHAEAIYEASTGLVDWLAPERWVEYADGLPAGSLSTPELLYQNRQHMLEFYITDSLDN